MNRRVHVCCGAWLRRAAKRVQSQTAQQQQRAWQNAHTVWRPQRLRRTRKLREGRQGSLVRCCIRPHHSHGARAGHSSNGRSVADKPAACRGPCYCTRTTCTPGNQQLRELTVVTTPGQICTRGGCYCKRRRPVSNCSQPWRTQRRQCHRTTPHPHHARLTQ